MQCTLHRSYKMWLDQGVWPAHVVMLCSLSVPVHSPEHWKIEDHIPSFPGKKWDYIPLFCVEETLMRTLLFPEILQREIISLSQGITEPHQDQCQCTKYSRYGVLGSAGGRTQAMKVCMHAAHAYSSFHLQCLSFWWAAGSAV